MELLDDDDEVGHNAPPSVAAPRRVPNAALQQQQQQQQRTIAPTSSIQRPSAAVRPQKHDVKYVMFLKSLIAQHPGLTDQIKQEGARFLRNPTTDSRKQLMINLSRLCGKESVTNAYKQLSAVHRPQQPVQSASSQYTQQPAMLAQRHAEFRQQIAYLDATQKIVEDWKHSAKCTRSDCNPGCLAIKQAMIHHAKVQRSCMDRGCPHCAGYEQFKIKRNALTLAQAMSKHTPIGSHVTNCLKTPGFDCGNTTCRLAKHLINHYQTAHDRAKCPTCRRADMLRKGLHTRALIRSRQLERERDRQQQQQQQQEQQPKQPQQRKTPAAKRKQPSTTSNSGKTAKKTGARASAKKQKGKCTVPGCENEAHSVKNKNCKLHAGGPCQHQGCTNFARLKSKYCVDHGKAGKKKKEAGGKDGAKKVAKKAPNSSKNKSKTATPASLKALGDAAGLVTGSAVAAPPKKKAKTSATKHTPNKAASASTGLAEGSDVLNVPRKTASTVIESVFEKEDKVMHVAEIDSEEEADALIQVGEAVRFSAEDMEAEHWSKHHLIAPDVLQSAMLHEATRTQPGMEIGNTDGSAPDSGIVGDLTEVEYLSHCTHEFLFTTLEGLVKLARHRKEPESPGAPESSTLISSHDMLTYIAAGACPIVPQDIVNKLQLIALGNK